MQLKEIISAIETLAPLALAQSWDNVGFLAGDPARPVRRILLTIDTTAAVVQEAIRAKTDLIIAYHPIIWDGLKRITADGATASLYRLIQAGIGVYCIHTALDAASGGINDQLADLVGIENPKPLGDYVQNPTSPQYKLITFVPAEAVNTVAEALYAAGAGAIGNYSHCGFQTRGVGTFLPLDGANPAIGQHGKLQTVEEIRLETVVPAGKVGDVLAALRRAHPYETPAFDVFKHYDLENAVGLGRYGKLKKPMTLDQIVRAVSKTTGAKAIGFVGNKKKIIRSAAVCAGSCGKLLDAAIQAGCDLYLTGELKHHQALAAQEAGLCCLCLSHTVSERFALKKFAERLQKRLPQATIRISRADADPFVWKEL